MDNYDYTLLKSTVNEAVGKASTGLESRLDEIILHLKEIKELLYIIKNIKEPYQPQPYVLPGRDSDPLKIGDNPYGFPYICSTGKTISSKDVKGETCWFGTVTNYS